MADEESIQTDEIKRWLKELPKKDDADIPLYYSYAWAAERSLHLSLDNRYLLGRFYRAPENACSELYETKIAKNRIKSRELWGTCEPPNDGERRVKITYL
jgi:hypothetical protein